MSSPRICYEYQDILRLPYFCSIFLLVIGGELGSIQTGTNLWSQTYAKACCYCAMIVRTLVDNYQHLQKGLSVAARTHPESNVMAGSLDIREQKTLESVSFSENACGHALDTSDVAQARLRKKLMWRLLP